MNINNSESTKSGTILVIEDNKEIQSSIQDALVDSGYNVFTADNGKEGLLILSQMPPPCLILLDLMMPLMNGWEFIEEINKNIIYSNIPIVVVSALGNKSGISDNHAYLEKPIDLDCLLQTVAKHCG